MARKTKKRAKKAPTSPPLTFEALPLWSYSESQQDCKAHQLPRELLVEILSHFKAMRRPSPDIYAHRVTNVEYLERTDNTRALSQTCRYWRSILLPILWESLDVCATHSMSGSWYQVFKEALIRKCTLMIANPGIASHVRTVNVMLTGYSSSTVLPAFVRGLEALPNLKVLCLICSQQKITSALREAFEGHMFPQIEAIYLPTHCHSVLGCCPSVRKVVCNDGEDPNRLVNAIAQGCEHVEEIDGFSFKEEQAVEGLVKAIPNLRSVKFRHPVAARIIKPLASCKTISHITIQTTKRNFDEVKNIPAEIGAVDAATEVIRNSPSTGRKSVVLSFCPNYALYFQQPKPEFWSKTWEL